MPASRRTGGNAEPVTRSHAQATRNLIICHEPSIPTDLPETTRTAITGRRVRRPLGGRGRSRRASDACETTIVLVTENALPEARLSIESVLEHTADMPYELRVVDNGSTDGTVEYLQKLSTLTHRVLPVFNAESRGMGAAHNQGLALARGATLVLLGQDCFVPPGWLDRLAVHLEDPAVGLVGPVTNRATTEAQINARYSTYGEFCDFAGDLRLTGSFDIPALNTFCVAMRRDVYERVGPFDERFEISVFEEEDYAIRLRHAGYRVVCARNAFVHNGGRRTIGHLTSAGTAGERFHERRRLFEEKWGLRWYAYDHLNASKYDLLRRIRAVILQTISQDSTVLMVSRGDEEILSLAPRAWHFPRTDEGTYAGHYPGDSAEAIAQLETQRSLGADFLLIPHSSAWWLTYYEGWRQHLESHYATVVQDERTCVIFDLRQDKS